MKILYIVSGAFRGGGTVSFLNLVRGMRQRGVDVLVITPETGFLTRQLDNDNIEWRIVSPIRANIWPPLRNNADRLRYLPRILNHLIRNHRSARQIERIADSWQPDIIHSNVSVINAGFIAAKRLGIPHIWHIREYGLKDFNLKRFPSEAAFARDLANNSHAICITRQLADFTGNPPGSAVIYNGIEPPASAPALSPAQRSGFLYTGYISHGKGISDLLNAYAIYCRSKAPDATPLKLIGRLDPHFKPTLDACLNDALLRDYISLDSPKESVYDDMQSAKAVIVPSLFEGFGRTMAEAMINGALVIGRNTAGLREQFDNGLQLTDAETGLRFDSLESLVDNLYAADNLDDNAYADITKRAQRVVSELYAPEKNVNDTLKFYLSILKPRQSPQ